MSKKGAPCPLLIRHRYLNPFPPPPFPPKLLHISTDPARYAGYRFLTHLENEREIPVFADADLGMPIELGLESDGTYGLGTYWEGDRNVVCPSQPVPRSELDSEDVALLVEPPAASGPSTSITNGVNQNSPAGFQPNPQLSAMALPVSIPAPTMSSDRRKTEVSWLRRTEYFNDVQHKPRESLNNLKSRTQVPIVPKTKTERLAEIHATFDAVTKPFQKFQHPTKPHLKPVDAFEILPDESIWANTYDLYRFQENPTDRTDQSLDTTTTFDERLEHAILRPVPVRGDTRLAYYLPHSVQGALNYKKLKQDKKMIDHENQEKEQSKDDIKGANPESEEPALDLHFVREYEISQQRSLNQYLLIFDDGKISDRKKGAYFNAIGQLRTLRKRRPKPYEHTLEDDDGNPLWDGISVVISTDPESIETTKSTRKELLMPFMKPANSIIPHSSHNISKD
ncbi:hypothetical protein O181_004998 [Austropuccinia psidii MF-1]|uniref:Uncharacterized protein n=1 Tax=Austropuccinia psidii MF-1 TaxID=1389203 RepID=A0A9Q3BHP8_9BASI|nr:hypothetical protein [Austropuccinia psidii MF-1]